MSDIWIKADIYGLLYFPASQQFFACMHTESPILFFPHPTLSYFTLQLSLGTKITSFLPTLPESLSWTEGKLYRLMAPRFLTLVFINVLWQTQQEELSCSTVFKFMVNIASHKKRQLGGGNDVCISPALFKFYCIHLIPSRYLLKSFPMGFGGKKAERSVF